MVGLDQKSKNMSTAVGHLGGSLHRVPKGDAPDVEIPCWTCGVSCCCPSWS